MLFPLSLLVFTIYPFTNVWGSPLDQSIGNDNSKRHDSAVVVSRNLTLTVPSSPPAGKQIVDGNYQSYSIEFSYMLDYAGNLSNPNTFSSKLLQNLKDISGAYPIVRAGGTTQNRAVWVQNQTVALIQKFGSNPDQPSSLSIGPLWLESFKTFPKGIQYIFGLSFYDGDYGLQQTLLEAIPAVKELGSSLYAFEIGNEVDGWPGGSRRPANYTVQSYVDQWLMFAKAIGNATNTQGQPLFQAAAFEAPRHLGDTSLWNAESILRDGIAKTGLVKTISDHDYMGSNCPARTQIATLEANLLNHTHMTSIAYYHDYLGNYSVSQGTKYVLGETNSISCQGQLNVSDVFGAALWAVDYVLYMSSLNVSRLYFHAGTPYRYSAWQPIAIGDSPAHVKALYYSNLFTATAFAAGNKQVSVLVNETFFTAYAVYDAGVGREEEKRKGGGDKRLTGLVLVNLQLWNSTMDANKRPYTSVKLPKGCEGGKVRRLTSPGAETGDGMTFAGRSVALNGEYVGKEAVESIGGSEIKIAASEAILVSF